MKILVFVKHVPDTETRIKMAGGAATAAVLDESDFKYMVNPYDEFAIEEALAIKAKNNAEEIVVASLGPTRCQEAIRKALAMGADSGIWISTEGVAEASLDSGVIAAALAQIAREVNAQLIFTGQKAIDDDCGHIGPMVAEHLGIPHVQVVTAVTLNSSSSQATVSREVEGGMIENYDVTLPAVFGAHKSLNQPRFPSLPGIMKAKKKPLNELSLTAVLAASGKGTNPTTRVVGFELPPEKQPGRILKGKPAAEMVKEVVGLLRSEAKVI